MALNSVYFDRTLDEIGDELERIEEEGNATAAHLSYLKGKAFVCHMIYRQSVHNPRLLEKSQRRLDKIKELMPESETVDVSGLAQELEAMTKRAEEAEDKLVDFGGVNAQAEASKADADAARTELVKCKEEAQEEVAARAEAIAKAESELFDSEEKCNDLSEAYSLLEQNNKEQEEAIKKLKAELAKAKKPAPKTKTAKTPEEES